jgi:hypothetical protein
MQNKAVVAATSEGRYWRLSIGPEKTHKQTWGLTKYVYGTSDNIYGKRGKQIQVTHKAKVFLI